MALTLAYDAAQERQYQKWLEDAQRRADLTERLHSEIKVLVLLGLTGQSQVRIPYSVYSATGVRAAEESVAEAVYDALNHAHLMERLMKLLEVCATPEAADLRVALAEQIAKDRASGLAEVAAYWEG